MNFSEYIKKNNLQVMSVYDLPEEYRAEYRKYWQEVKMPAYHQRLADMHAENTVKNSILKTFIFGGALP